MVSVVPAPAMVEPDAKPMDCVLRLPVDEPEMVLLVRLSVPDRL